MALPTWLVFTDSARTFAGTPAVADTGTVSVKVTASDGNGGSDSDDLRYHHRPDRARRPDRPHGNGQRDHHDRPLLDGPGQQRRLRHHRLQDRSLLRWRVQLDRPRRQHRQHHHHLRALRAGRRRHPPLPRLGHQLGRHRPPLRRRQHHHRHHRARRPDRPHGNGQREHHDQPLLERPRHHRRLRHHRLQDRGLPRWRLQLDRPRRQHPQHRHHLRPHRAGRRHHAPLPRLGHQHQRDRHPLQHRRPTTGTTAPGAPTRLTATASGTTTINLSWTAPASNGGSAITGYKIEVSSDGGSNWTDLVANTDSTATTYAHTGLADGDTRHYRVSAINSVGTGLPSNVDDATTDTVIDTSRRCSPRRR